MMKKILSLLVMMSLLVGVVGVLADGTQNTTVTVADLIVVVISPGTIEFGPLNPGTSDNVATSGSVTLNADGSNVDIQIDVTVDDTEPFESGLKFTPYGDLAEGQHYEMTCIDGDPICTYGLITIVPTLDIPAGFLPGLQTGVVTYTIAELV